MLKVVEKLKKYNIEVALVLFVQSGLVKAFTDFYKINTGIDFTLITMAFLLLTILKNNVFFKKRHYSILIVIALFIAYLSISLGITPSEDYGRNKYFLVLMNIFALLCPLFVKKFKPRIFIILFIVITGVASIFYISVAGTSISNATFSGLDEGTSIFLGLYLTLAQLLGISILLLATSGRIIFQKQIDLFVMLIFILLLVLTGARGPFVALIIVFPLYYLFNFKSIRIGKFILGIILILMVFPIVSKNQLFERSLAVRSRMIPNLFMEKFRFLFLPILQGLYGSFMSQCSLRNMLVV
jgi:hypothetical protein